MRLIPSSFGFPLLGKELLEQAARRRTYIIRVVYASVLFFLFAMFAYEQFARYEDDQFGLLGKGEDLFEFLVAVQFGGIYIFLPAMVSGVLTYEKERRSLELLFLTTLSPWKILLEKLFGRLIPMFIFLLLTLPLMAIAYAYGGISTGYLASGTYLLFLTCFQVGALSLAASSYYRTTGKAFLSSYGLILLLYLGILIACMLLHMLDIIDDIRYWGSDKYMFCFVPPYLFDEVARRGTFGDVLVRSIPVIASAFAFLLLARAFLVRRAFVPAKDAVLLTFKRLDRAMSYLNRFAGGIVLVKDKKTLPGNRPIAWRETTKKSLGKLHYLVRILVVIEIPVLFVCVMGLAAAAGRTWRSDAESISAVVFFLWAIAILMVCVKSSNTIVSERTSQTLDVLLTTPLSGADIIRQKMHGVRRLIYVLMVPLITCFIMEAWWEAAVPFTYPWGSHRNIRTVGYLAASFLSIFIYLPMFSWVSLWIGLKARSKTRAIATTLAVIVGWMAGPFLIAYLILLFWGFYHEHSISFMFLFSPVTMIIAAETGEFHQIWRASAGAMITVNFLLYAGVLFFFRWLCLKKADHYLGRAYPRALRAEQANR